MVAAKEGGEEAKRDPGGEDAGTVGAQPCLWKRPGTKRKDRGDCEVPRQLFQRGGKIAAGGLMLDPCSCSIFIALEHTESLTYILNTDSFHTLLYLKLLVTRNLS